MQHTALLPLPEVIKSLGLNVMALEGWDEAQGAYMWTDPENGSQRYENAPSCYMVHHTGSKAGASGGAEAVPVVQNSSGVWSKANAWIGLWDGERKLYEVAPSGVDVTPAIILTSAGPARYSSGFGVWSLFRDYLSKDIRAPYWDQPEPDGPYALNRYAVNVETVHRGGGQDIDPGVLEHVIGLGVALHILFGWKDRTTGHLTWTQTKKDPHWNDDPACIVQIQDAVVSQLTGGQLGMPYEQFCNMVDALFRGRPDKFQGSDPGWFYRKTTDTPPGIYDDPSAPDWPNFWDSFEAAISRSS